LLFQRVIGDDYTFSFAGRRYQIARQEAQAGMQYQRLRVELHLDGQLKARYQGPLFEHSGVWGAGWGRRGRAAQACSPGSQRRRQKFLDAGLLRPAQSAPLEVDRRLRETH